MPTALIAEDEPLLAEEIKETLARLWPELEIAGPVHDGIAALRAVEAHRPEMLFLDVQMPGLNGIEVARVVGARSHVVFITAYDHYAVQAFDAGAVDYLLKPLEAARMARAVQRIKARLDRPPADLSALLDELQRRSNSERLQWLTVLQGRDIQFISVEEVCYFRADNKYVAIVTADRESLITTPLRDLLIRLDPSMFWQIHRGTVVNVHAIQSVRRSVGGKLELRLKTRPEALRVSVAHAAKFRHL